LSYRRTGTVLERVASTLRGATLSHIKASAAAPMAAMETEAAAKDAPAPLLGGSALLAFIYVS
jgi:hypothetical protein